MNQPRVLLLGAGNIGPTICELLLETGRYRIKIADQDADALARLASRGAAKARSIISSSASRVRPWRIGPSEPMTPASRSKATRGGGSRKRLKGRNLRTG